MAKWWLVRVLRSEKAQADTSSGNRFYSTLCYAREVASKEKSFKFEIIRDFQTST